MAEVAPNLSAAALQTTLKAGEQALADVPWLSHEYFGNSLYAYLLTAISFVLIWAVLHLVRTVGFRKFERYAQAEGTSEFVVFFRDLIHQIRPYLFPLVAVAIATKRLELPQTMEKGIAYATLIAVTVQAVRLICATAAFLLLRTRAFGGGGDDLMARNTGKNLVTLMRFVVWAAAILFLLDNFGFNVSTFVAGLGIGGVAIALSVQAILGDAFSSFAIALDKPFEVGDYILVDGLQGTVEFIGLKTTRVRSLGGELSIFSNSDLTKARIQNYKRMHQRRVPIVFSVTYDTSLAKLKRLPAILQALVETTPNTTFDRAYCIAYTAKAINFELVYYVTKPDARTHLEAQQEILLKVNEAFAKEKINLAFDNGVMQLMASPQALQPGPAAVQPGVSAAPQPAT